MLTNIMRHVKLTVAEWGYIQPMVWSDHFVRQLKDMTHFRQELIRCQDQKSNGVEGWMLMSDSGRRM